MLIFKNRTQHYFESKYWNMTHVLVFLLQFPKKLNISDFRIVTKMFDRLGEVYYFGLFHAKKCLLIVFPHFTHCA